jgi:phage regulator Rha-like protein
LKSQATQNWATLYFKEIREYSEAANREVRYFEMARDGFSLLVMGFSFIDLPKTQLLVVRRQGRLRSVGHREQP